MCVLVYLGHFNNVPYMVWVALQKQIVPHGSEGWPSATSMPTSLDPGNPRCLLIGERASLWNALIKVLGITQEQVYSRDLITSTSYLLCCYNKTSSKKQTERKGLSWFRDRIRRSGIKGTGT